MIDNNSRLGGGGHDFSTHFLFSLIFFFCIAIGIIGTVLYHQNKLTRKSEPEPTKTELLYGADEIKNREKAKNIKANINKYISFIASVRTRKNNSIILSNLPPDSQNSEMRDDSERELMVVVSEDTKIVKEAAEGGEEQSHLDEIDEGNMILIEFNEAIGFSNNVQEVAVKKILILAKENHKN